MLEAATWLLAFQLAGEAAARLFQLPVPGPVIGMVMLAIALMAYPALADRLRGVVDGLLSNLGLLFVPAGVGVSLHLGLLEREWLPITVALLVSTVAGILVTAFLMRLLMPAEDRR
ncbi:holin-like protein [Enhydrobacter aerosaccus]|uniref:Holin-like protein n=1 Tax=Enhydrobacter aerosaccus TaxID=225324 RepID=A0A1T4TAY8_9HYPH|nr:CidA/LrgA family protein [Enhydrobacter aerosaccus]SKA37675.1 holin-like protein [Enhydrobacter aerosaccus]